MTTARGGAWQTARIAVRWTRKHLALWILAAAAVDTAVITLLAELIARPGQSGKAVNGLIWVSLVPLVLSVALPLAGHIVTERDKAAERKPARQAGTPTVLVELPRLVTGFVGRDTDLAKLVRLLEPGGAGGPVVISAVSGLAGVGKTTLAVAAAHAAWRQGWFPGGILFLNLHGYDDTPVQPGQALDALLRALDTPDERIPPDTEDRTAKYRSILAQMNSPVLIVADNASSEAQIRPLLPGAGGHRVLVTSRHTLAGLDAQLVDLTVLDEQAAAELLDVALRIASSADDRINGDPLAASRLARLCDGLPLALQITAALLKADPALGTADLAEELSIESGRLEQLTYDDGSQPPALSVAAAFELSYRRLDKIQARVFRLLAVNPGPELSNPAVAAITDLPARHVRGLLSDLARAHMIEPAPGADRWQMHHLLWPRWRMHDLLRLYTQRLAGEHAGPDGQEQARDRLLNHYLRLATAATQQLVGTAGMAAPAEFSSRDDALTWLDAERENLMAAVGMAAATGRDLVARELPFKLAEYLNWRRRFDDWVTVATISVDAARRLDDPKREAQALDNFGLALRNVRRFDDAITAHQDAVATWRHIGDLVGESRALNNLGIAFQETGRFPEAVTAAERAVAVHHEIGDQNTEGRCLTNLGLALQEAGRLDEAIQKFRKAATIHRETGDRHSEGSALDGLGLALQRRGNFAEAIAAHEEYLTICRETGDRHAEAIAHNHIGLALKDKGHFAEAIAAHHKAAAIYHETGDSHGEGLALANIEAASLAAGEQK
jgi:tetratricopeptide (TPR) repeat protein